MKFIVFLSIVGAASATRAAVRQQAIGQPRRGQPRAQPPRRGQPQAHPAHLRPGHPVAQSRPVVQPARPGHPAPLNPRPNVQPQRPPVGRPQPVAYVPIKPQPVAYIPQRHMLLYEIDILDEEDAHSLPRIYGRCRGKKLCDACSSVKARKCLESPSHPLGMRCATPEKYPGKYNPDCTKIEEEDEDPSPASPGRCRGKKLCEPCSSVKTRKCLESSNPLGLRCATPEKYPYIDAGTCRKLSSMNLDADDEDPSPGTPGRCRGKKLCDACSSVKTRKCLESPSHPLGMRCATPEKYPGKYHTDCRKMSVQEHAQQLRPDQSVSTGNIRPIKTDSETSYGKEVCIQTTVSVGFGGGPIKASISLEVGLAGSITFKTGQSHGNEISFTLTGSVGLTFGLILVKAAFYVQGAITITALVPKSLADASAAMIWTIRKFAIEGSAESSMGKFVAGRYSTSTRLKDLVDAARDARKGRLQNIVGINERGLIVEDVKTAQANVLLQDSRDLLQVFVKEFRAKAADIQATMKKKKFLIINKGCSDYHAEIEKVWRHVYLKQTETVGKTHFWNSATDCNALKDLEPMQRIMCTFFVSGGMVLRNRRKSNKNLKEMISIVYKELLPGSDETHPFACDTKAVMEFLTDVTTQYEEVAKPFEALADNRQLVKDRDIMEREYQNAMKAAASGNRVKRAQARLLKAPLDRQRMKVKRMQAVLWLGTQRVNSMFAQNLHMVLSTDPDKLPDRFEELRELQHGPDPSGENRDGYGIMSKSFVGTRGVTVGKDGVGFCTPDGNPVQFKREMTTIWERRHCTKEEVEQKKKFCFKEGKTGAPVYTGIIALGTWIQIHMSFEKDPSVKSKFWSNPWKWVSKAKKKISIQLRLSSATVVDPNAPPKPDESLLQKSGFDDMLNAFFQKSEGGESRIGRATRALNSLATFLGEYSKNAAAGQSTSVITAAAQTFTGGGIFSQLMKGLGNKINAKFEGAVSPTNVNMVGLDIDYDFETRTFQLQAATLQYYGFGVDDGIPLGGPWSVGVQGYSSTFFKKTLLSKQLSNSFKGV